MHTITIRANLETRDTLRHIAKELGEPMLTSLAKAVELYRRQSFLQKANSEFGRLRKNPKAWKAELKERKSWDATMNDNLTD
jgi:hypothetical protein